MTQELIDRLTAVERELESIAQESPRAFYTGMLDAARTIIAALIKVVNGG